MFLPKIKELRQVKYLMEEGKINDAFKIVLELEKGKDLSLKELLSYKLVRANLLFLLGNFLDAIELAKEIFQEFQKLGDLISSFDALLIQANSYMITANITQSEVLILQAEKLFKIIKATSSIDLRERESHFLKIKAGIHFFKGEIQQSLELNKRSYELAKDTGNKALISSILNNISDKFYHMKEYNKAIMYAKQALRVNPSIGAALGTLTDIYISKGDIKEAKVYLDQLRELSEKFDSKWGKTFYHHSNATILKSSLRARDRIKAEDIFKELALDKTLLGEPRIEAIINLCDLYLTELRITNDPEIINEIHPYIQELLSIAKKHHLYLYLSETHLLQAKLSLLTLEINKAKGFLTQAQKIAELYGLKRLAMKISYEHDELLRQTKMWENLKTSELSLSERLELTGLNEQMRDMLKRGMIEVPEFSDEEPVLLLILSEGGVPFFTQSFIEDQIYEEHLFGGFITSINAFINNMFSEGLNRASFGEYTLLMNSVAPFLMCYIYKGQSYSAQKRIRSFIDALKKDEEIWDMFEKFYKANRIVQKVDIPSLKPLIKEIFGETIH